MVPPSPMVFLFNCWFQLLLTVVLYKKEFLRRHLKTQGVGVIAIMISVSGELVLLIRLLWIRFLTLLHRISWKSHQPAGKENPISSGQWLRDIDCVFLHLEASSQVGGHSESHNGCHIGSLAGGHGSWGPLKGYFIHHGEGIWNYGNDDEREMDGYKLYHFKGKISQAMMTFDVDIGA